MGGIEGGYRNGRKGYTASGGGTPVTREELEEMIAKITAALEEEIKGENESLDEIRTSLVLPDSVDGYPFSIAWLSGDYERIQADGSVNNAEIEQKGELVELTATLTYLDQTWEEEFMVRVCPPILTPEEESRRQLEKEAQENEKEAVHEESFPLPEQLGGQKIVWKEKAEDNSPWFFAIILLAGAVQYRFSDEALKKSWSGGRKNFCVPIRNSSANWCF